ncbi:craniofacial development protein 2-like [Cydia pomonella]|uniref:craniofacial development protein 2-like n=1 Tax=Cydia pomonella TaxID=82600 RepID=UPI002ADE810F|nr:craniofacial development protein 2-like [Cydia pomonella]
MVIIIKNQTSPQCISNHARKIIFTVQKEHLAKLKLLQLTTKKLTRPKSINNKNNKNTTKITHSSTQNLIGIGIEYSPSRLVIVGIATKTFHQTTIKQKKKQKNKLYIATFNVRTLLSYERLIELEESLEKIKFEVTGMSEVRKLGNKIEEYEKYILCYIGSTSGKHGVGFLINKSLKKSLESFKGITEIMALLNLNLQGHKISIIQTYAPPEPASEDNIKKFYKDIDRAIESSYRNLIIMGDFNAKIGKPLQENHIITKKWFEDH